MTEIIKISENTWRLESGFVRMFLLAGTEKALLVDTGAGCPEARQLAESVTDKPVSLICTHGDGDHTSGNGAFAEFMMHPADYKNCGVGEKFPDSKLVPISDGDVIELGGRRIELIHIPGHTEGSVAMLDVGARVLIAGDSVQDGHVFMFGPHRRPAMFAGAMEKLIAVEDKFDRVWASHGTYELPGDYVRKVAAAWQKVLNGEIEPHEEELHRSTVLTYDTDDCGFYCDLK